MWGCSLQRCVKQPRVLVMLTMERGIPPCLPSIAALHQRGSTTCVDPALSQCVSCPGNQ